ncbi:phosphoribosyltransferase [Nonomuraea roseoviolacea]|uniref:Uncharacterized protein n=1 Tax=Nonomuraea roseoviolacea subsp. carminata TaxID=160689 RepID=A0ABT1JVK3_9ACTN|nr:phosphoribosyltransferase [Nonomuraea roseoviolacea]MCP2345610.1 hypothetical protein [Nonomuraea roseoviolacea subsp. carminata]
MTERHLGLFRNVPAARPGLCRVCHSAPAADPGRHVVPVVSRAAREEHRTAPGEPHGPAQPHGPAHLCAGCLRATAGLHRHTPHVLPVSLCARTGDDRRLYDLVTRRRPRPGEPSPATLLAATLARFHRTHLHCLTRAAGGPLTLVTTVPGAGADRPAEAFDLLPRVVQWVAALRGPHRPVLMPGGDRAAEAALARHVPDERAFHVLGRLDGERVLLLDGLFVTGARVQSAASALYRAGAEEVVALVLARLADPWADTRLADAWARPYDFGRCCLCDPAARLPTDTGRRARLG